MGKATIQSEYGDGKYSVVPSYDKTLATARIAALTAENTSITTRLTELASEIAAATSDVEYAAQVLHAAVVAGDDASELQEELNKITLELADLQYLKSYLTLTKTANAKQIEWLTEKITDPAAVDAWCADLTEGVTGEVATVEIGRVDDPILIKPAAPAHVAADDGQLQPLASSTPAAVFYNLAMLPAAAKWKPRYRTGTASNIDTTNDTMDVTLDALTIQGQDCNQNTTLEDVPVSYMTCNASAFTDGDDVLVEFTGSDWAQPTVVGFAHDPQPCQPGIFIRLQLNGNYCAVGGEQVRLRYTDLEGSESVTAWKAVPEVGAPCIAGVVPADNYSLAGPIPIDNIDVSLAVTVELSCDISHDYQTSSSTFWTDSTDIVGYRDKLFCYYDSNADAGDICIAYTENAVCAASSSGYNAVDHTFDSAAIGSVAGLHVISGESGNSDYDIGTDAWEATTGDENTLAVTRNRYKVIDHIKERTYITIATFAAGTFESAITEDTSITPVNLENGVSQVAQILAVSFTGLKTLRLTPPDAVLKGHNSFTLHWQMESYEDEGGNYLILPEEGNSYGVVSTSGVIDQTGWERDISAGTYTKTLAAATGAIINLPKLDWWPYTCYWLAGTEFEVRLKIYSESGAYARATVSPGVPLADEDEYYYPVGDEITIPLAISATPTASSLDDNVVYPDISITVYGDIVLTGIQIAFPTTHHNWLHFDGVANVTRWLKTSIDMGSDDWWFLNDPEFWHTATITQELLEPEFDSYQQYGCGVADRSYMSSKFDIYSSPAGGRYEQFAIDHPNIITDANGSIISGGGSYSVSDTHEEREFIWYDENGDEQTLTVPAETTTSTTTFTLIDIPGGYF